MKLIVKPKKLLLTIKQTTFEIKRQFEEDQEEDWHVISRDIDLNFFKDKNNEYKAAIYIVENAKRTDVFYPLEVEVAK